MRTLIAAVAALFVVGCGGSDEARCNLDAVAEVGTTTTVHYFRGDAYFGGCEIAEDGAATCWGNAGEPMTEASRVAVDACADEPVALH